MFIPPAVLVLVVMALLLLAMGIDPTKKYGPLAIGLLAIAVLAYFGSEDAPRLMAALKGR